MTQKFILNKNIIELRGIKIDLGNLSKIQSPVLRETIKRLFYSKPNVGYDEYHDSSHKEYHDHKEYTEHYEDWDDWKEKKYDKYFDCTQKYYSPY
jgi:ABC-type Zn2+ transport system substrate-binding protein/surface adhesin